MNAPGQTAIDAGDHVLASDDLRVLNDAIRHEFGMLEDVGFVATTPGMIIGGCADDPATRRHGPPA
jgi:hypothetical protein